MPFSPDASRTRRRRTPSAARSSGSRDGRQQTAGSLRVSVCGLGVTTRRRLVRVPGSSANLGPGFDILAAALSIHLELEVSESGELSVDPDGLDVPTDRSNLCVRAFESLHPADGLSFRISGEIPLARGLGSSAAAIVAALLAADHLYELG